VGYRIKGSAIVALMFLTQVASSQRGERPFERPTSERPSEQERRRRAEHPELDSERLKGRFGPRTPKVEPSVKFEKPLHAEFPDSPRPEAAPNDYDLATQASTNGDWDTVYSLLKPLTNDPDFSTHALAKRLYGQASLSLAKRAQSAGDPRAAVPLFSEAFTFAPPQGAQTAAYFKNAIFTATALSYKQHDWKAAQEFSRTVQQTHYFSVTPAEREAISLVAFQSGNWLQAGQLPSTTLVVDHIKTETNGSYFQVFGVGGTVDILVKASTIDGLLVHPDFRAARDALAQGADMVLTPAITRMPVWENALHRDLPQTTFWSDPYISDAAQSLVTLQQTKLLASDLDLAILLPKNADQQAAMGLQWTDAQRDHAWQSGEYLKANSRGASVITQSVNRTGLLGWATDLWGTDSKKDVLDSLRNRKGVIILFAHGDRDGVYTPDGKELTVQDVQSLDLHANHPIVLLLSCEGNARAESAAGSSLAQALKKSGATAVWSYGQKVDAGEAASAAVQFLGLIRRGKSPLDSFRSMSRDSAIKAGPVVHLKVRLEPPRNAASAARPYPEFSRKRI
jgi:hypothetical protein